MNKTDLEKLVAIRLEEARILLQHKCYPGAYYLTGYALECALKACIAKQVRQYDFPNKQLATACHTHNLADLIGVAELKQKLAEMERSDDDFKLNWSVAKDWKETARYDCAIEETVANNLYEAVTDKSSGILEWLKSYW